MKNYSLINPEKLIKLIIIIRVSFKNFSFGVEVGVAVSSPVSPPPPPAITIDIK